MGVDVGQVLCEVRKRRGLTQRELANESGVSLSTIRRLEQGERAETRLATARSRRPALPATGRRRLRVGSAPGDVRAADCNDDLRARVSDLNQASRKGLGPPLPGPARYR